MKRVMRISSAIIFCLIIFSPTWHAFGQTLSAPEKDPWNMVSLMRGLAQVGEGAARFKEERHVIFLSEPLIARGNIRFKSPDFLFKHTESPKDERLVVFADEVTITNLGDGLQRTFSLNDYPHLRGILDAVRYTLSGNIVGLNKYYKSDLQGERGSWRLNLAPRPGPVLEFIRNIKIFGRENQIFKIEIYESNGDHTVMHIEPNNP